MDSQGLNTPSAPWRRRLLLLLALAVVLGAGGVIAAVLLRHPKEPPAGSDLVTVAKFVASSDFRDLPEARKRPYMRTLRAQQKELSQAREDGRLTSYQYEEAYLNAWLERQLDHMDDFFKTPAAQRQSKLVEDAVRKAKAPRPATEPYRPDDTRENKFMDRRLSSWSAAERVRWEEFRQAVKKAKEAAKKAP